MKLPKIPKLSQLTKNQKIIGGIAGGVLLFGVLLLVTWLTSPRPADNLYKALAKDTPYGHLVVEQSLDDTPLEAQVHMTPDGTVRADGSATCSLDSSLGHITLRLRILEINANDLVYFDEFSVTGSDNAARQAALNKYFNGFTNKWIAIIDDDPQYAILKQHGVVFGSTSAVSSKVSGTEMAKKLRDSKAITIVSTDPVIEDGKQATKYNLEVRRSAYDNFMDSMEPNLDAGQKAKVLSSILPDDVNEVSVVVDNATGMVLSGTDSMDNLCYGFLSEFDPDAAAQLPKKLKFKTYYKTDDPLTQDVMPNSFLTSDEFSQLLQTQLKELQAAQQ